MGVEESWGLEPRSIGPHRLPSGPPAFGVNSPSWRGGRESTPQASFEVRCFQDRTRRQSGLPPQSWSSVPWARFELALNSASGCCLFRWATTAHLRSWTRRGTIPVRPVMSRLLDHRATGPRCLRRDSNPHLLDSETSLSSVGVPRRGSGGRSRACLTWVMSPVRSSTSPHHDPRSHRRESHPRFLRTGQASCCWTTMASMLSCAREELNLRLRLVTPASCRWTTGASLGPSDGDRTRLDHG